MVVRPGDTIFRVPAVSLGEDDRPCRHLNGWLHMWEGEEWLAPDLQQVGDGVDNALCELCGEMWFRNEEGHKDGPGWHQKYWTKEEVDEVMENAKKYDAFFDLPDDSVKESDS